MLELSNYWDDFQGRVNSTIDCLSEGKLPNLERLTVHLTEQCNFRCSYCNMHFSSRTMAQALAFKIVDEFARMGGQIIHFTGGEPSIVPYINQLFEYAHIRGLQVSSNTNGFKRIDTRFVDKLKTSFDTPYAGIFNETMGVKCFAEVVENMRYYSETMKGKMLSITAVLNKKTYPDMLALAKFVQENFKVYNLYFSNYKGSDPDFAFSEDQIKGMFTNHIPRVLEYFKETGNEYSYKQLTLYKPNDFINADCRFDENKTLPCYIQLSEMTIDVDGSCHNCNHLFRDKVKPNINVSVDNKTVSECFKDLKDELGGNYICLSDKCLNGCNTNLIGFNRAVSKGEKI